MSNTISATMAPGPEKDRQMHIEQQDVHGGGIFAGYGQCSKCGSSNSDLDYCTCDEPDMAKLTVMDVTDVLSGRIRIAASYSNSWKTLDYKPISEEYTICKDGKIIGRTNDMENAVTIYNQTEI